MSENQREAFFAETTGLAAEAILVRASNRFGRRVAFASSLGAEDPPSPPARTFASIRCWIGRN